jgi:hypothetical protein
MRTRVNKLSRNRLASRFAETESRDPSEAYIVLTRPKYAIRFIWALSIVRDRTEDGNLVVIYGVWVVEPITITNWWFKW